MNEIPTAPPQTIENRIAAIEGAVAILQAQIALLVQQQYRGAPPPQIRPNVCGLFGE
jgi:hypothetical protein